MLTNCGLNVISLLREIYHLKFLDIFIFYLLINLFLYLFLYYKTLSLWIIAV